MTIYDAFARELRVAGSPSTKRLSDGITQEESDYLLRVYTVMIVFLVSCITGVACSWALAVLVCEEASIVMACVSAVAYIVVVLVLMCSSVSAETESFRMRLVIVMSFLLGILVTPIIRQAVELDPSIIIVAALLTFLATLLCSYVAYASPSGTWSGAKLALLTVFILFLFAFPVSVRTEVPVMGVWAIMIVDLLLTLAVFTARTASVLDEYRRKVERDHLYHAFSIFVGILDTFLSILQILIALKKGETIDKSENSRKEL